MNRDDIIDGLVGRFHEQLEQMDNTELLGDILPKAREKAIERLLERRHEELEYESD